MMSLPLFRWQSSIYEPVQGGTLLGGRRGHSEMRPILYPILSFLPLHSLFINVSWFSIVYVTWSMFECEKRGDRKVEFCGEVEGGRWEGGRWKVGRWKGSFVGRQNTNCKISMAHCPLPTLMHFTLGHGGSSLVRPKLQQSSELERFVLDLNKLAKLLQRCNSARHFRFKSVTVTNTWIWSLKRAL